MVPAFARFGCARFDEPLKECAGIHHGIRRNFIQRVTAGRDRATRSCELRRSPGKAGVRVVRWHSAPGRAPELATAGSIARGFSEGDQHGLFTQKTRVRGGARSDRMASRLQFAKRPARASRHASSLRRAVNSDHRRFHRGADSAGGRDGEGRQKAHASRPGPTARGSPSVSRSMSTMNCCSGRILCPCPCRSANTGRRRPCRGFSTSSIGTRCRRRSSFPRWASCSTPRWCRRSWRGTVMRSASTDGSTSSGPVSATRRRRQRLLAQSIDVSDESDRDASGRSPRAELRIQSADVRSDPQGRVPLRQQSARRRRTLRDRLERTAERCDRTPDQRGRATTTSITAKPRTARSRRRMRCSRSTRPNSISPFRNGRCSSSRSIRMSADGGRASCNLDRLITYIKSKRDVWFATMEQAANYVKQPRS